MWRFRTTVLCLSLSATAAAQTAPALPRLVPPQVVSREEADYSPGATGAQNVILELVIQDDGSVGDIIPISGPEPFASAAIKAAKGYTFTPAKRGDIRISARIRLVVEFAPAADLAVPPPAPATTGVRAADLEFDANELPDGFLPPGADVKEVRVQGVRESPTPSATEHRMARANVGRTASFPINAELFFAPTAASGVTFDEVAASDANGDGIVTGAELVSATRTCTDYGDAYATYCTNVLDDMAGNLSRIFGPGAPP